LGFLNEDFRTGTSKKTIQYTINEIVADWDGSSTIRQMLD